MNRPENYSGKSRTTKWRKRKRGTSDSSIESDKSRHPNQPECSPSHSELSDDGLSEDASSERKNSQLIPASSKDPASDKQLPLTLNSEAVPDIDTSTVRIALSPEIEEQLLPTNYLQASTSQVQDRGIDLPDLCVNENIVRIDQTANEQLSSGDSSDQDGRGKVTIDSNYKLSTSSTRESAGSSSHSTDSFPCDEADSELSSVSVSGSASESSQEQSSGSVDVTDIPTRRSNFVCSGVHSGVCHESEEAALSDTSADYESDGSDTFSSECFDSYEVRYLEEEPHFVQHERGVPIVLRDDDSPDPEDPEDPDDPENPSDNDDGTSGESDDEEQNPQAANFMGNALNDPINVVNRLRKGELILMELANSIRHKDTFKRSIDAFKNMNVFLGPHFLPESKTKLWSDIQIDTAGIQHHVYCGDGECGKYIGLKDTLGNNVHCDCGFEAPKSKAKFFVTLNIANQLRYLLNIPGIWEKLQYRTRRHKVSETAIEDVYDSSEYKRLQQPGEILSNPYNFSYIFNMDTVNPTKKGSMKLMPILIRINELPPDMRQKFHLLAAVYVDNVKPNLQSFLKPYVRQANRLSTHGITWKPDGVNEVNSKFVPFCHCVDSPVRCGMLNMAKWDSQFGCTYCTHRGRRSGGSQRYPVIDLEGIPNYEDRTHGGMTRRMLEAQELQNAEPGARINHFGHKGTSQLMLLLHHKLREGQGVDDLHQDHEGVAADLTELLLTVAPRIPPNRTNIDLVSSIDAKLLTIKTPSRISRKPRSVKKRGKWKGTEWRNWLYYYGVVCMFGLIDPRYINVFACISHACYLLSKDVIEPVDIAHAERLMGRAMRSFEQLFGVDTIKFNLHVTTSHKANSVRTLGPPWVHSTYNYESLNCKIAKMVTSPKGAVIQLVTMSILNLTVAASEYDIRVSEEVRLRIGEIMNKERLQRVVQVDLNMYLIGSGTEYGLNEQEVAVLEREGIQAGQYEEFKGFLIGNTRYQTADAVDPSIKSDDSFVYTRQDRFGTIRRVIQYTNDVGERHAGAFVMEHNVNRVVPIARHLYVLSGEDADVFQFIPLTEIQSPAIRINTGQMVYAVAVPNCHEID